MRLFKKTQIKYPVRCEIIDVTGEEFCPGIKRKTPEKSKPYIGKHGLAEKIDTLNVRITLDDGSVLFGYECWWKPLD